MRRTRNLDPYLTTARFDSKCPETGKDIKKGDRIAYFPATRTAYSEDSKAAEQIRAMQFSAAYGMADSAY